MENFSAELQSDLKEFIELLVSTNVEFLIVGAHAVAFHGHPRLTGDLDLLIRRNPDNAKNLETACAQFGFVGEPFIAAEFLVPDQIFQLGRAPNRIDILTSISGVDTDQAWQRRIPTQLSGVNVSFISKEDLIQNKRATGRAKDLADIEVLLLRS